MNKLASAFQNGKALLAFLTCGDPDLDTTAAAARAAEENGAALLLLGVPFSDPTAEGPVLQASNLRALRGGVTTDRILAFVKELRGSVSLPLALSAYANVVFSYGPERFLAACRDAGIGGLLLFDVPYEERGEFLPLCRQYSVELISTAASAPEARVEQIAREAEGFLSLLPCAGPEDLRALAACAARFSPAPCVVEPAAPTAEALRLAAALAAGVILREPLVELLERCGKDAPEQIGAFLRESKRALAGEPA